ncbi:MAG: IS110 family transposase [Candidatus Halalkalibacterium sp. M3_1C_030]
MSNNLTRLGCGLDISKQDIYACFGGIRKDGTYVIKGSRKFENTPSGIKQFLLWLNKKLAKYNPSSKLPFQVVMEPTGVYHEDLLGKAYEAGLPVCVVLAQRVKYYLLSVGQINKTDTVDAKGICRMACELKQNLWKPCSPNIMQLRSALRHRKSLVDSQVRHKNQLHARKHSNWSGPFEEKSLRRMIKMIDKEINVIEKEINRLYMQDEVLRNRLQKIIDSVHGLGMISALTVVAETNGFAQIRSRKQLTRYAGYDIIQNQSGQREGRTKISKRGNSRIRAVMHMASLSVVQKEGPLQALYLRILRRNPKIKMKGYVAVQRKLLLLIYTLYKNNTAYDTDYHKKLQKEIGGVEKGSPHSNSGLRGIDAVKTALPI